jgi:hypothetical protein
VPLTAAAAVVIAIVLEPTRVGLPARGSSTQNDRSGGEKPPFDVAQGGPELVERPKTTVAASSTTVRLTPETTYGRTPPETRLLPPAAIALPSLAIAPIEVAPLGAARLAVADSIELQQLDAVTPIDVTPLGLDDSQRRDE